MQSEPAVGLTGALKAQTRDLHTAVERTGVMRELLRGHVDRPSYCLLLRNLQAIYEALEAGLAGHTGQPWLSGLWQAQLARREPLEADLGLLHGPGWAHDLPVLPAAAGYVARLRSLERDAPETLLAHVYVRYLGDLSGGQILRDIVARGLGPAGAVGTRFYEFGDPEHARELARQLRAALDAIALDTAVSAAIVAEAQWSFARHADLFREIAALGDARAA